MTSNTYCPFPWIGLNVVPNLVAPCCYWAHDEITGIVDFEKVKQAMINGERVPNCAQCYHDEEHGKDSRRTDYIKKYGVTYKSKLKVLDISFDNVCNLKCRGCVSTNSHLIFEDEKELYGETFIDTKYVTSTYQENLDYSELAEINLSGGEPLLSKKAENFMYDLLQQGKLKNIFLGISTNCTVVPSERWMEIFRGAKDLWITLSIDGHGGINDYFRSGADFESSCEIMKVFDSLFDQRTGLTEIQLHTTVSAYNVNLLAPIKTFTETNFPRFKHTRRLLMWPNYLSINHLPADYKKIIRPIVEAYGNEYAEILNFLDQDAEDHFEHFINAHTKLDFLRQETLKDANPLFYEYIEQYKKQNPNRVDSKIFFIDQIRGLKT